MESHNMTLRDIPREERPRERMLQFGARILSNSELVAILLRTGTVAESAVGLAQRVLKEAGGIRGLVNMSTEQMMKVKGIGYAKALQLQAAIELGKRLAQSELDPALIVRSPQDVARYVMEDLRYLQKEHFVCLFLNTKNHVIAQETLSIGSLNASIVHPREVFRAAIERGSASLICIHNHPSGDPTPSPEDVDITHRLVDAGNVIGIEVLDHLIIGDQKFVSLKEQGLM